MGDRVKGKVAIVVGAGSIGAGMGIGKASAILYSREGAQVMLVDINLEAAEETKHLIDEEGGDCITFKADVSKSSDCRSMVEKCIDAFGRVDILDNNVGIYVPGGPVEISEEDWDRVMNVNLKGMFLTCKYALPHMEKQGSGSIINISAHVMKGAPVPRVAYVASKVGVIGLTREIAFQYASKGIRANAIVPGLLNTPWATAYLPGVSYSQDAKEMDKVRAAMVPMGKQGDAWDIAYSALFLATDEAKYITGVTLFVDGGVGLT